MTKCGFGKQVNIFSDFGRGKLLCSRDFFYVEEYLQNSTYVYKKYVHFFAVFSTNGQQCKRGRDVRYYFCTNGLRENLDGKQGCCFTDSVFDVQDKSIGDKQGECMKNISFFAIVIVAVILLFCVVPNGQTNAEYLRIHIRADSNSQADQAIKYKVKAAVVDYLTPYIACADSKQKAVATVQSRLSGLQAVADSVLAAEGFTYKCRARLATEEFPTRCYNGFTLSEGVYDALILDLGSGSGDNWWCVVYPPLCFVGEETDGSDNIVYRSLIRKIIDDFVLKQ